MSSVEVTVRLKPDIKNSIGLLAERSVLEQTGCGSVREGRTYRFLAEGTEAIRSRIVQAIEDTGAFSLEGSEEGCFC